MDLAHPLIPPVPVGAGLGGKVHRCRAAVRRNWRALALTVLSIPATVHPQNLTPTTQPYPRAYPVYPQTTPGAVMMPERMAMVDPDKKLAVGDQITLEIAEDREGGIQRMVTATGELDVPPLGRVRVAGRTATEAASEIKQALEHDYYYHATVRLAIDRVSPIAVRAGVVYLSGEVRAGGPQEIITGETLTLTSAILKAGGIGEWGHHGKVKLTRQNKDGTLQTIISDYDKIIKSGDSKLDPVLQDGDRIFVPRKFVRLY